MGSWESCCKDPHHQCNIDLLSTTYVPSLSLGSILMSLLFNYSREAQMTFNVVILLIILSGVEIYGQM